MGGAAAVLAISAPAVLDEACPAATQTTTDISDSGTETDGVDSSSDIERNSQEVQSYSPNTEFQTEVRRLAWGLVYLIGQS